MWDIYGESEAIFGTISPSVSSFISNIIFVWHREPNRTNRKLSLKTWHYKPRLELAVRPSDIRYESLLKWLQWPTTARVVFLQTNNGNIKTGDTISPWHCLSVLGYWVKCSSQSGGDSSGPVGRLLVRLSEPMCWTLILIECELCWSAPLPRPQV